ncbi:MAG: DNRLRE domain-containing protein [Caldilineaceae bacterium]
MNITASGKVVVASPAGSTLEKSPIADTYVAEGNPNTAPSAPDFKIFWLGHNQADGFGNERALLKFDISSQEIPTGSTIQSAKLLLTLSGTTKNDSVMDVTVRRLLSDQWNETLTWNDHLALPVSPSNPATTAVSRNFQQYEWNIQGLVQEWANSPLRIALGLRLESNQTSGDHERNFWAKDCKDNECSAEQRPKLVIEFETPATPTSTPTAPHTPTATPTPTVVPTKPAPGIATLRLESEPTDSVGIDEDLHYIISFAVNNVSNFTLDNVTITDTIPAHVRLVTETLSPSSGFVVTYTGVNPGAVIRWTREEPLMQDEGGSVSYHVVRTESAASAQQGNTEPAFAAEPDPIYNDGVDMSWTYNGVPNRTRSNYVRNPPLNFYLPFLPKQ